MSNGVCLGAMVKVLLMFSSPPSGLNLNMSAAEMRAKLASKKKADPRRETVDLKKKYEIIQNM